MTFKEAFDKAHEVQQAREKDGVKFAVSPRTARTLAFMWNILASADFVLDDFAFIVENNGVFDIVSVPLKEKGKKKEKGQKPSTVANDPNEGDDGSEKENTENNG